MKYLKIKNWDTWQSYRKDRPGAPPWIKVHRNLMSNMEWSMLTDSEKGHLISIWILAADRNGRIPSDPNMLRKMCQLDNPPDTNKFIDLGFIEPDGCQDDNQVTTTRQPDDVLEESRVEENRIEKNREHNSIFKPPTVEQINDYIREKTYHVDPERFYHFYESKNWMVGKNKMKNWKSAVAGWNQRNYEGKGNGNGKSGQFWQNASNFNSDQQTICSDGSTLRIEVDEPMD